MGDDVDINLRKQDWKHNKMAREDDYDQFIYKEWRSYLYRYITLITAVMGFSVTLFGTDNLASQISFSVLLEAYQFLGYSIIAGFFSIGYSLWKERRILWGKMYGTLLGEQLIDDNFRKINSKTRSDYRAKKLNDEVNSSVIEYPILLASLTFSTFIASVFGFYFLIFSLQ